MADRGGTSDIPGVGGPPSTHQPVTVRGGHGAPTPIGPRGAAVGNVRADGCAWRTRSTTAAARRLPAPRFQRSVSMRSRSASSSRSIYPTPRTPLFSLSDGRTKIDQSSGHLTRPFAPRLTPETGRSTGAHAVCAWGGLPAISCDGGAAGFKPGAGSREHIPHGKVCRFVAGYLTAAPELSSAWGPTSTS